MKTVVKRKGRCSPPIKPGMLVREIYGPEDFFVIGEWPGSGYCTLTNLRTGKNFRVQEDDIRGNYRLFGGVLEISN